MSFEQAVTQLEQTNAELVAEMMRFRDAAAGLNSIYPSTADGIAAVEDGKYFVVPGGGTYQKLYRRNGSQAEFVSEFPSVEAMDAAIAAAEADAETRMNAAVDAATDRAESASVTSVNASNDAIAAADSAESSAELAAQNASGIYASVGIGLSNTIDGEYFKVPEQSWVQLYRNDNGSAYPVLRLASQEELERLNTRLDPLLTTLVFS